MSEAAAQRWFERSTTTSPGWVIDFGGRAVGMAWLKEHPYATNAAQYSVGIWAADARGKHLGREATALVLEHAFTTLGLHRVELSVLAANVAGVRCYESCGFRIEGRSRETLLQNGAWIDDLHMGILVNDWRAQARPSA